MKLKLNREGYQRYSTIVHGHGLVTIHHATNPNAAPCNRWKAYGHDLCESAFTLKEMRRKLDRIHSSVPFERWDALVGSGSVCPRAGVYAGGVA